MTEKIQGTVKWFSNKKGYGFITPIEGSSFTDDIFVHQSAIHSDGYRTLDEQWQVEFEIGHDDDGKPKADNVTAPGGGPCTGPRKARAPRRRRRRGDHDDEGGGGGGGEQNDSGKTTGGGEAISNGATATGGGAEKSSPPKRRGERREPQPIWHDNLSEEVKQALKDKNIRTSTGTIDISFGNARIKLGTRNYASLANGDKVLAEGSFNCTSDGLATFEWKRALRFTDVWNVYLDLSSLANEISLTDESVKAVGVEETMITLMGEGTTDPRSTLEANGFEMRRVVLTTKRR
mmetsp:Transcript_15782/g.23708  ORF Transcript_15782/g.23708 Transcript_15782/m.23708 type:complete len:291 (-) Transcript_15782:298-1170(-)